jgi:hypothetical protein
MMWLPIDEQRPSQVQNCYWLVAERRVGSYPSSTPNCGKWLVFVPVASVDRVWQTIKNATEAGLLGSSAKVATAKPNPNANSPAKVICVYTYDWTDEADVRRIRQVLRDLGVTAKIPYKADQDTYAGRYVVRGNTRISKYYE